MNEFEPLNDVEFDKYLKCRVFNEKGEYVSGCNVVRTDTREKMLEVYATGCGWSSADNMREFYPIDQYRFEFKDDLVF